MAGRPVPPGSGTSAVARPEPSAQQAGYADHDQVDGHDEVEQARDQEDEDSADQGNDRLQMNKGHETSSGVKPTHKRPSGRRVPRDGRGRRITRSLFRPSVDIRAPSAPYPSILEKSATARVASRISLRSLRRFSRSGGSSTLTVTLSKNASTRGRKPAMARMAVAKSSRATASPAACLAAAMAAARSRSSSCR